MNISEHSLKQLREAPHGALVVWPYFSSLPDLRQWAKQEDRLDLTFITPNLLYRQRGRMWTAVVVDYACKMTPEEWAFVKRIEDEIIAKGKKP